MAVNRKHNVSDGLKKLKALVKSQHYDFAVQFTNYR